MKNFEQILTDAGITLTEEQKTAVTKAVAENYKTVAEFDKQARKLDAAETKASEAEEALKAFDGVDVEGYKKTIEDYKKRAEDAEKKAQSDMLRRDQEAWLKEQFDALGVKSERARKSLAADIMGEDGLKWKDGQFLGFADYVKAENEKDKFYDTPEEKGAESKAPKFTDPDKGGKPEDKKISVPPIW